MEIIDLIRLMRKHLVLLLITPILMAALVTFLTRNPSYKFESGTTLYTGIASGSSVEMDKSFNYFASNTAFDNFITIIKSRETQQEVAIRLLAQHLLLQESDPRFISNANFEKLQRSTPAYVKAMVVNTAGNSGLPGNQKEKVAGPKFQKPAIDDSINITSGKKETTGSFDQADTTASFSFSNISGSALDSKSFLPSTVDELAFEETVKKLNDLCNSNDTNFVHKLLNFDHPNYSIDAISNVNVYRITSSDLIQLKYQSNDPGICQQTLLFLTDVSIRNYKKFKGSSSDAVVKYFEFQLKQVANRLKTGEDKLLHFNEDNNIINYYEQSKAVATVKEEMDVDYNNKRIKLAGLYAVIKRLEEKLENQQLIQLKSSEIIEKRNQLGEINFKISQAETVGMSTDKDIRRLADLKVQAEKLKDDIRKSVGELYNYTNSVNGLPVSTILNDWINNVIEAENVKAGMEVQAKRIKEFQKQYAIYAPAGANVKRIEREISVAEQEFLENLHGLNLAKLKLQDNELASNIKPVDPPYYPLNPIPTKRKLMILAAAMLGFIIVLVNILVMEFFDSTLKNPPKVSRLLKLPFLAVFPKILLKVDGINFPYITNRMLEIAIQNIQLFLKKTKSEKKTKTILIFSTLNEEGKTIIAGNLAQKLKLQGEKVFYLNYSLQSLHISEYSQLGFPDNIGATTGLRTPPEPDKFSIINWLLGYPDTRTDPNSQFLNNPANYLLQEEIGYYKVNDQFYLAKSYQDILNQNGVKLSYVPDYVLIEIPSILYYPYPVDLIVNADIALLICRSNRVWSTADQGVLNVVMQLAENKTHFILNGAELPVIESILGDLPKERSTVRRYAKQFFRLLFFSKNKF